MIEPISFLKAAVYMAWLACVIVLALPAGVLLGQVLLALLPQRKAAGVTSSGVRTAVLVPAHNESTGVLPTLHQLLAQARPGDRVVVIADNCSDDTADVARGAGAEVVERHDTSQRGKGYALNHGVNFLRRDPPDVVVIIDADCDVAPDCIAELAHASHRSGCPVQGMFMTVAPDASLKMRVAEFAMRVKAHVRPRGMAKLGLPCGLTGSGIAYPWPVIADAPLASGHLAEDMQLGLELGRRGTAPIYCEAAKLQTVFAATKDAQTTQRTRWEHGHLALLVGEGPRLLASALIHGQFRFAVQVLDLLVPPLALLTLLQLLTLMVSVLASVALGWSAPLWIAFAGLLGLSVAVLAARARFASDIVTWGDILKVPLYVMGKLPIYVRFLVSRQVEWVRTKRDRP
jgi:cellulose synthase/poly-beta-1,6-N-acetylglucosamine synthase-like glycosyltransferase